MFPKYLYCSDFISYLYKLQKSPNTVYKTKVSEAFIYFSSNAVPNLANVYVIDVELNAEI